MEPETNPVMDVSVRISAGHHAPRRGQHHGTPGKPQKHL